MDVSVGIERQHLHVDSPDDEEGRVQEAQQIIVDRASRHLHSTNAGAINEVKCYIRGGVLCP